MQQAHLSETLLSTRTIYDGRVLTVQVDTTQLPNGRTVEREIVRHPGAVAIVAVEGDTVVLVRQYRHAVGQVLLEVPAGKLEPGEDLLSCAERELAEETGLRATHWQPLGQTVVSPGFCDEIIHLFRAEDLSAVRGVTQDEDECIEVVRLPWSDALAAVGRGEIIDAKTQVSLMLAFAATSRAGDSTV